MSRDQQMDRSDETALGIPIGAAEFRTLVDDYFERMKSGADLTVEDYLTMTRLWNTIELRRLKQGDESMRLYAEEFFPRYVPRVAKALGAVQTKGMALYSKEHDVYIGGPAHANSQYSLR
jgi:hypothetical protein